MKRREFLLRCALSLPGLILANPTVRVLAGGDLRRDGRPALFSSIGCLTDRPEAAIRALQRAITRAKPDASHLGLREFMLPGRHVGDIALTGPHGIVNPWESQGELARDLREIAMDLDLPRAMVDPTFLAFETETNGPGPRTVLVARDSELLAEVDLDGRVRTLRIPGPIDGGGGGRNGETVVSIGEGEARIISAACRHRTCVEMGAIAGPGQSLVCVPARLTVSVRGRHHLGVDSVAG